MGPEEMTRVGGLIARALEGDADERAAVRAEVDELVRAHPAYPEG
jgi:glycine/serine hydroxymethyltransferase